MHADWCRRVQGDPAYCWATTHRLQTTTAGGVAETEGCEGSGRDFSRKISGIEPGPRVCTATDVLASLRSAAVFGVDAFPVLIEVDVAFGLPHFTMVGLPDATVRESRDRVRSAIRNSGFEFPPHRITVNLAPADVRKGGSSFDLPIALGLLAASGPLARHTVEDTVVLGELSLDGGINAIRGVLPIAVAARRLGLKRLLLPPQNAAEACAVKGLEVCIVRALPRRSVAEGADA